MVDFVVAGEASEAVGPQETGKMVSEQDKKRIEHAIEEAERQGSAEIVVAWMPASATYAVFRWVAATLFALATQMGLYVFAPRVHVGWVVSSGWLSLALAWFVFGQRKVLMALTPDTYEVRAVERHAQLLFLERRIYETSHRCGVLILFSEIEHHLHAIADRGLDTIVNAEMWAKWLAESRVLLKKRQPAEAVVHLIHTLSSATASTRTDRSDDRNLPNDVVVSRE